VAETAVIDFAKIHRVRTERYGVSSNIWSPVLSPNLPGGPEPARESCLELTAIRPGFRGFRSWKLGAAGETGATGATGETGASFHLAKRLSHYSVSGRAPLPPPPQPPFWPHSLA
jgi:hypothetical protein